DSRGGQSSCRGRASSVLCRRSARMTIRLQRQNIRPDLSRELFAQGGITGRQYALIQGNANLSDPDVMEVMELAGADTSPVVNGHGLSPQARLRHRLRSRKRQIQAHFLCPM